MSSANALNLDKFKILSFGKDLARLQPVSKILVFIRVKKKKNSAGEKEIAMVVSIIPFSNTVFETLISSLSLIISQTNPAFYVSAEQVF